MEPFIVSARKYRPQTFKDVVGQQTITNTLLNAIENNHLAQALLFCGPRGVGKTTCARILAKQINQDGALSEDEDFAFNIFELDAASNNSVDDIRSLIDQVRIPPQVGKYKVYIIDEVHMLSQAAFNAFLKTLEEPPKHAIFILATTEKHKIIPTILSRCQIFDFKRITVKDAKEYLKYIAENQGIEAEDEALHIIAQKADGAMRDALSIFDRVVSFSGKQLTRKSVTENLNVLDYETFFDSTDLILNTNIPELLLLFNKTLSLGFDGHHYINGLASHFRDLMVCQHTATMQLIEVGDTIKEKYVTQTKKTSRAFLLQALDLANDCDLKYKASKNQRLLVELTLMKLASINFDGEKKKGELLKEAQQKDDFIAPAAFFQNIESEAKVSVTNSSTTENKTAVVEKITEPQTVTTTPEIQVAPISVTSIEEKSVVNGIEPSIESEATELDAKDLAQPDIQTQNTVKTTVVETISTDEIVPKRTSEVHQNIVTEHAIAEAEEIEEIDVLQDTYSTSEEITSAPETNEAKAVKQPQEQNTPVSKKIDIKRPVERVSGLSISSLKAKKQHELNKIDVVIDQDSLPNDPIDETEMQQHWADFVEKLDGSGRKILASNLHSDIPKLIDNTVITICLPNDTMKKEIEREQYDLMEYLKLKLNNHFISLKITVSEEVAKKFAFTPEEKYEKLREKNPTIDLLRKEFDLDL